MLKSQKSLVHLAVFFFILLCLLAIVFPAGAAEKTYTNSLGMEFVLIPNGSFLMGAEFKGVAQGVVKKDEDPVHQVTISKDFYLAKYPVTQGQWMAVMEKNPSRFRTSGKPDVTKDNPVEKVSWDDIQEFIKLLNQKEGHSRYRLPTEAEWEYAARAGTTTQYYFGDDKNQLVEYAWYEKNSGTSVDISTKSTRPVGQKKPNAWGLYDMYGNVWEWVQDLYTQDYYVSSPQVDPAGPSDGQHRVMRGGSWDNEPHECRSAKRKGGLKGLRGDNVGFRLAISLE